MRLAAALCAVGTGCFYLDPINLPPTTEINEPAQKIERGKRLELSQSFGDPDGGRGSYVWNVYVCRGIERNLGTGCDAEVVFQGFSETVVFDVPRFMHDQVTVSQVLDVQLDARDDRGAIAHVEKPFAILDAVPELELTASGARSVGAPIDLVARFTDADDDLGTLESGWTVTPPSQAAGYTFTERPAPVTTADREVRAMRLVADTPGRWSVAFAVTDPNGLVTTKVAELDVVPDGPPCLAQWQPIVPPAGATLPIGEPTVFQIPLVQDDLDMFPAIASEPLFGTATFAWSILPPGATARRAIAGATGNSLDFDPRDFAAGGVVELRVEVFDRHRTPVSCPDALATCALTSDLACLQRQTWRVEVR